MQGRASAAPNRARIQGHGGRALSPARACVVLGGGYASESNPASEAPGPWGEWFARALLVRRNTPLGIERVVAQLTGKRSASDRIVALGVRALSPARFRASDPAERGVIESLDDARHGPCAGRALSVEREPARLGGPGPLGTEWEHGRFSCQRAFDLQRAPRAERTQVGANARCSRVTCVFGRFRHQAIRHWRWSWPFICHLCHRSNSSSLFGLQRRGFLPYVSIVLDASRVRPDRGISIRLGISTRNPCRHV